MSLLVSAHQKLDTTMSSDCPAVLVRHVCVHERVENFTFVCNEKN
jgi:hypothetical protein